jgi:2-methylcitrate dehydratase
MSYQEVAETRSAVESIATFAVAARQENLTPDIRQLFKRNILDSIGCAIASLPGAPFQALRKQFEEYRAAGRWTLIDDGKTSVDQGALFNSGLVRYVDVLDGYMSPGGLCHPSDNFGTVLAAAEHAVGVERGIYASARRRVRNRMAVHCGCPCGCGRTTRGERDGG